ncbi:hypothetical protein PCH_Pc23g00950 [Penicillium rubens Wisconsin 54-1255]|uniref:Uncharacterized protein n=1 Tax=Penicillium rubens (strain ATCC 28089 / DSM 1075 / NRRL 1951 / Wisconsin 54-1255) TaxID=500485 RepID=B6HWE5_PENRW|nr:hypothetical protein PCH_Pc23g00950 [Penicillium rubens Wisconsin 54-1255]
MDEPGDLGLGQLDWCTKLLWRREGDAVRLTYVMSCHWGIPKLKVRQDPTNEQHALLDPPDSCYVAIQRNIQNSNPVSGCGDQAASRPTLMVDGPAFLNLGVPASTVPPCKQVKHAKQAGFTADRKPQYCGIVAILISEPTMTTKRC